MISCVLKNTRSFPLAQRGLPGFPKAPESSMRTAGEALDGQNAALLLGGLAGSLPASPYSLRRWQREASFVPKRGGTGALAGGRRVWPGQEGWKKARGASPGRQSSWLSSWLYFVAQSPKLRPLEARKDPERIMQKIIKNAGEEKPDGKSVGLEGRVPDWSGCD